MKIKNKKQAEEFLASARKDISEVENWLKNHESTDDEKEKLFLELTNNLRIEIDDHENRFFNLNNEFIFIQNTKYKTFHISYYSFWKFFYDKFNMKDNEIISFIENMLSKYYDLKEYKIMYIKCEKQLSLSKYYENKK